MSFTAGRCGYKQDIDNSAWVTIFDETLHGKAPRGMGFLAGVQSIQIEITPLHYDAINNATRFLTIDAGEYRERFSTLGRTGLISKVRAKSVVAGGVLTWDPVLDAA